MFKLRFYRRNTEFQKEKNEKILKFLEDIKKKHGIDYEVFDLKLTEDGYIDEQHEKMVYEKHFKPRAKVLKQRIGESLPKTLRSRRGRGHYYLSGVIALLEDDQIGWYTCYESCKRFENLDEDYTIGFLKALQDKGYTLLEEICPDISTLKSPHDFLVDEFVRLNPLGGNKIQREVRVGSMIFRNKYGSIFDWRKSIDLVVHTKEKTWVIEVKPKLNWEAFGQVIAYEYLLKKEKTSLKIQKGIICKEVDSEILAICEEFDITVFLWQDGEFKIATIKEEEV